MDETRIVLAGLWVALMLTYLLGDVLRIFAGDFTPGQIDGEPATQWDSGGRGLPDRLKVGKRGCGKGI